MGENPTRMTKQETKVAPVVKLSKKVGNTTYRVTLHFKEDGKEDMNDKIKRLIRMECA